MPCLRAGSLSTCCSTLFREQLVYQQAGCPVLLKATCFPAGAYLPTLHTALPDYVISLSLSHEHVAQTVLRMSWCTSDSRSVRRLTEAASASADRKMHTQNTALRGGRAIGSPTTNTHTLCRLGQVRKQVSRCQPTRVIHALSSGKLGKQAALPR